MKRTNAEIHPFPTQRVLQNAKQNAYQGMKKARILQSSQSLPSPRILTRAAGHLQNAAAVLDALLQQDQDRLPPAMAADLNEAVGLIFEALQRVSASGLVMTDGADAENPPQSAANLR